MPSMDLTQTLNKKKSLIQTTANQNNSLIDQLEEDIAEMEQEYHFMDNPIKTTKPTLIETPDLQIIVIEPSSPMLTINEILLHITIHQQLTMTEQKPTIINEFTNIITESSLTSNNTSNPSKFTTVTTETIIISSDSSSESLIVENNTTPKNLIKLYIWVYTGECLMWLHEPSKN